MYSVFLGSITARAFVTISVQLACFKCLFTYLQITHHARKPVPLPTSVAYRRRYEKLPLTEAQTALGKQEICSVKCRCLSWQPSAIFNFKHFHFWFRDCCCILHLLLCTKLHQNRRIIRLNMVALCHLGFVVTPEYYIRGYIFMVSILC